MAKEFAKEFYNSAAWDRVRKAYAKSVGGLCESCLVRGVYRAGKIVHHIRHITPDTIGDPDITLNFDNLKLVCQDCHAAEHATPKRYVVGKNGEIIPPGR